MIAACPGRKCLLFGTDHEHVRRDPTFDGLMSQVAAIRRAEWQRAEGTWRCPGCGRPYEELPVGHHWTCADGGSCGTVSLPVSPEEFMAAAAKPEQPPTIRMVGDRRMQCKDIPDRVFLDAVRRARGTANCGWRPRWEVHVELELAVGMVPENLLLAKARGLIRRRLMGGCACGCRGDWHPVDECQVGSYCCRPREGQL